MEQKMRIAIAETGYVGMNIAALLAQHHTVYAVGIIQKKVDLINQRKSPIVNREIEEYLAEKDLDPLQPLTPGRPIWELILWSLRHPQTTKAKRIFDTLGVQNVIKLAMEYNPDAIIVIKSTIPVGYTRAIREKTGSRNIIFSQEFLRESRALYDNLYSSRILGTDPEDERLVKAVCIFAEKLKKGL